MRRSGRGCGRSGPTSSSTIFANGRPSCYQELLARVERVLSAWNCPAYYHALFVLRSCQEFSIKEVSRALDVNENTAKVALLRTRKILRKMLRHA
ncbi:MAG TPA: sigma factor-like helix-turn-helix DNA-binding protein [Candidatus Paceibacterota bacterium]|nr:sigma factor-like helix-turn-helix DNA-binding protein [Candidatus Paceibacterota bacterium]